MPRREPVVAPIAPALEKEQLLSPQRPAIQLQSGCHSGVHGGGSQRQYQGGRRGHERVPVKSFRGCKAMFTQKHI